MAPGLRKFALTAHVTFSVGWFGAVLAYVALAVAGLTSRDGETVRAAYFSMELIGWYVIVPLCLASLLTGLVQALGTEWGVFRHYWVSAKFVLTVIATAILLMHMPNVSRMARLVAAESAEVHAFGTLPVQLLIHAVGGVLVLVTATTLSVVKPWGLTPLGRRKRMRSSSASDGMTLGGELPADGVVISSLNPHPRRRLFMLLGIGALLFVLHLLIWYLIGGSIYGH